MSAAPFTVPATYTMSAVNAAISDAQANGSLRVFCPAGVWTIDATMNSVDHVHVFGAGIDRTVFRLSALLQGYAVNAFAAQSFEVSDMTFDMGNFIPVDTTLPDQGSGVALFGGVNGGVQSSDCAFNRIKIVNMGLYCVAVRGGTRRFKSDGCQFFNPDYDDPNRPAQRFGFMLRAPGEGGPNFYPTITNLYTEGMCGFGGSMFGGTFAHARVRFSRFGAGFAGDVDDANGWNTGNAINDVICEAARVSSNGANGGFEYWGTNSVLSGIQALNNAGFGIGINRGGNVLVNSRASGNATAAADRYGVELFFDQKPGSTITLANVRSENNAGGRDFINHFAGASIIKAATTF